MAHVLKGYLYGLSTDDEATAVVKASHAAASGLPATERERGHVAALGHLAEGRWHEAGRVLEDVSIDEPRDALALLAGHQIDFFTGNSRMLRDRISSAMPSWAPGMHGYHSTLAMQAFGFEETGDYTRAEALGRHAIAIEPRDGWAQHAVAHVMEMQCRQRDGISWMRDKPKPGRRTASSRSTIGGIWRCSTMNSARSTRPWRCSTRRSTACIRRSR